ncbi:glycosyltransferase-like protein [Bifidobacterium longum]|nr:glycosyltransferase-like protein [Bifidobacterium longum]
MLRTVSVAMAVYNGEKYLKKQIESILVQLAADDELVISYDSSTDNSYQIISEYASNDSRVKILRNNRPGIVNNFNNALAACSNDVTFISDQDDLWLENKRNIMVDVLNESGADLAVHNVVHIDENDCVISDPLFKEYHIHKGLLRNFVMPRYSGCCMAFPSKAKRIILPMPESVLNYDHWIGMACEVFGTVIFVDDILLGHRLHDSNVTTSRRPLPVILNQRINLLQELLKKRRQL